LQFFKRRYPEKFVPEETAFRRIHWGDRILIGSGCGVPQHLLNALIDYVRAEPKALLDAEILQVWALGDVPYTDADLQDNLRHNSFFIGRNVRDAVNGEWQTTRRCPFRPAGMFRRGLIPLDVSIVQVSPPDEKGYMSLGVSVDIVRAAVEHSGLVIAQVNRNMPRTRGDSIIHIDDVTYMIPWDEPLLEYKSGATGMPHPESADTSPV